VRRIAFGSEPAARAFVTGLAGWSVISDADPQWLPIVGDADGPTEYRARPASSSH